MPVIVVPRSPVPMSPFMFSATLVGALARAGVEGVEPSSPGAERLPPGVGPLVLG